MEKSTFLLKGMKRATKGRNAVASQRNIWKNLSLERAECSSSFNLEFGVGLDDPQTSLPTPTIL